MTQIRFSQATVIVIPCPGGSRPAIARVCPADGGGGYADKYTGISFPIKHIKGSVGIKRMSAYKL